MRAVNSDANSVVGYHRSLIIYKLPYSLTCALAFLLML